MDVLIVGASVRAAAASLRRIGCRAVACDRFADADLAAIAATIPIAPGDYPNGIAARVAHLDPIPWLYTGALENHPAAVAAISRRFRLLGNPPAVLRAVRDPLAVAAVVRQAGLAMPATRPTPAGVPTDGSWLVKPLASGGGERIAPWSGVAPPAHPACYQERIAGRSCAAIFVRDAAGTRLIGTTRQYHGRPGNRFAYRGSLGPCDLLDPIRRQVEGLGRAVGDAFGLLGVFGVDLIVSVNRAWLIEVNPRYTASAEVLEAASGRSIMAEHLAAFGVEAPISGAADLSPPDRRFVAKLVLFARSGGGGGWDD